MAGHVLAESPLSGQTTTVGEAMRTYRSMDIPGIDLLIDGREVTSVKQAAIFRKDIILPLMILKLKINISRITAV